MKKRKRYIASLLSTVLVVNAPIQALAAGIWQYDQGRWYHTTENIRDTGWITEGKDIWYFLDENGVMQTGWYTDNNGCSYYLNRAGQGVEGRMRYGWYQDELSAWYFLNTVHDGSFGKALTGWIWVDGYCYCFDENGKMYANCQTPDGYFVDSDGRWIVDDVVQKIEGKGYQANHQHSTPLPATPSGGNSGGSSDGGDNHHSNDDESEDGGNDGESNLPDGIFEIANQEIYQTLEQVKSFDNTTPEGRTELSNFENSVLDIWISDPPEPEKGNQIETDMQEIQLLVTNDNPFYQYVLNGEIEEGDVIYIPTSEDRPVPLTLVYKKHNDNFDGSREFDSEQAEVLHTEEASLRQLLADEIQYAAGGVNANTPLAFEWGFQVPGTDEL